MRKTLVLTLLFSQLASGSVLTEPTCAFPQGKKVPSLLQTRRQTSKSNIDNGLQTWSNPALSKERPRAIVLNSTQLNSISSNHAYKKIKYRRCDGAHRLPGVVAGWSKAMVECDADPKCAGIMDHACQGEKFQLCSVGTVLVFKRQEARLKAKKRKTHCVHVKGGYENRFLYGENFTKDRTATDEKFWGQSGPISCDAQHFAPPTYRGVLLPGTNKNSWKRWNFAVAQKLCGEKATCAAIHDQHCDGKFFQFCTAGFSIFRRTHKHSGPAKANGTAGNDCIYSKKKTTVESDKEKEVDRYVVHKDQQCDVHSTQWDHTYVHYAYAKKACDNNPECSGLYDAMCNGRGFVLCNKGFNMIPTVAKGEGCVYTKPNWTAAIWTKSSTGCQCYFDESRTDCACCNDGACQCSPSIGANRCAPCNQIQKCVVSEDLGDFPDLLKKVSPALMARLNDVLDATAYESRQSGIRNFLRTAYELPSSKAKVQAVALLDAKLNRERSGEAPFEFPNATEVEDWLASWFLVDEIWEHANSVNAENKSNQERPMLKGLQSRGALIQDKFQKCDWQTALQQYYSTQGGYGNWCGKMPPGRPGDHNQMVSMGACAAKSGKRGKWGLQVCNDSGFDEACSRHDQAAYTVAIFGIATQSLCKVDADFKAARAKLSLESTFQDAMKRSEGGAITAANCLFDIMPCLRFEENTYWDWCSSWSGGYPCKKTEVGYMTHWPMGDYSQFKDDACGPPGCYSKSKTKGTRLSSKGDPV